jgi:hypothetical protein
MSGVTAFRSYWSVYGGFGAVFASAYFWAAVSLTAVTSFWWLHGIWWDRVMAITPNILGFSFSGYLLLLAVGSEDFMKLLARAGGRESALMDVSATFVHFIVVQFTALILTLLFIAVDEGYWSKSGSSHSPCDCIYYFRSAHEGLAVLAFWYSITTGFAATMRIFGLTNLYTAMVHADLANAAAVKPGDPPSKPPGA